MRHLVRSSDRPDPCLGSPASFGRRIRLTSVLALVVAAVSGCGVINRTEAIDDWEGRFLATCLPAAELGDPQADPFEPPSEELSFWCGALYGIPGACGIGRSGAVVTVAPDTVTIIYLGSGSELERDPDGEDCSSGIDVWSEEAIAMLDRPATFEGDRVSLVLEIGQP